MGFYEQISKFYDYIFPVGETQLKFLKDSIGNTSKRVLDIACGSGGYSIELAKSGHKVTAVDLDEEMVALTKQKANLESLEVNSFKCDMKELKTKFADSQGFDFIFCIGNSIVHLGSLEEIQEALKQMYSIMGDGGTLVLQIINFDRILQHNISELPTLINTEIGLEFVRKYEHNAEKGMINFNTVLKVNNENENERFENSVELFPVISSKLMDMLEKADFKNINFYGDFTYSIYDDKAFLLVVKAEKDRLSD
jgi:glycine/sarcosine N-methyltransferase